MATHRTVITPGGTRIHLVEEGAGPLVLLVHGFPESWYSWRHQLPALAAAGYRAVAIDVRGYGRSSRPEEIDAYRVTELVQDNAAVVAALGEQTAVIIGHDWGSPIASTSALLRPDVFTAVALLSVPYSRPGGARPTDAFAAIPGPEEFYISYFQQPGRAEAEIEPDVAGWLRGFYVAYSGDAPPTHDGVPAYLIAEGAQMRDRFPADVALPSWISEEELAVYATEFEYTGLTGGLNRYRNMDRDWEDLAPHAGASIEQPSLFIGGALDPTSQWMANGIERLPARMPGLVGSHLLEGAGHWIQQERPTEVNALLLDWLAAP